MKHEHFKGGAVVRDRVKLKLPSVVVNNITKGKKGSKAAPTGFKATPDGNGWWMVDGKRFAAISPSKGLCDPYTMVKDPAYHHCQPVPDEYYSGVLLSDGVYFWLQKFQLERHLNWILRTRYRMGAASRLKFVEIGVSEFISKIRRERGVNIFRPLGSQYTEEDHLLVDGDERVRDFIRRYGRDTRKLK